MLANNKSQIMTFEITSEYKKVLINSFLFFSLIVLTYWVYAPGVHGVFIFDDVNNLSPIGKYEQLSFWDNFWLFLLEGNSGPTGRPLSLASFYLNDTGWPSSSSSFIYTNILIHLLNGILVFWFCFKLVNKLPTSKGQQISFSLLATSFWLLHPLHTTTVLYVIQRMTELSATFTLTGLLCYLYGREILSKSVASGLLLLFIGVGLSLILSVLSKENGVLLVGYILVVEFFLLQPFKVKIPKYFYHWFIPTIILPFLSILIYLAFNAWQSEAFLHRNFTLGERLLTEFRILFEYIYRILIPNISSSSLFHDDFTLSTSLLSPWTTIPSIIGITLLIGFAVIARKKQPIIAFAIAWFLAGHLIESTVLPLELYFEHRNYLPMLGILIAITWAMIQLQNKHTIPVAIVSSSVVFLFSFMVLQNAILWSKPIELVTNWYKSHPNSQRMRDMYIDTLRINNLEPSLNITEKENNLSTSLFISHSILAELSRNCATGKTTSQTLNSTVEKLKNTVIHSSATNGFTDFISSWKKGNCNSLTSQNIEDFLIKLSSLDVTKKSKPFASHVHYWLAELYRDKHDFSNTMINLDKAYEFYPSSELLKLRAAYLASAGLSKEALEALNDTSLLENGFRSRWVLRIKQKEFDKLRKMISSNTMKNVNN